MAGNVTLLQKTLKWININGTYIINYINYL